MSQYCDRSVSRLKNTRNEKKKKKKPDNAVQTRYYNVSVLSISILLLLLLF